MIDKINHTSLGNSRLITQYRESEHIKNRLRVYLNEADEIETAMCESISERYLDNARGHQLDVIGEIVGQPREASDAETATFFGFADNPRVAGFGDLNDSTVGGRFMGVGEASITTRLLSDDEYRLFIRARIVKNHSEGTIEDVLSQLNIIFPDSLVLLVDGNMNYQVNIQRELTINERLIFLASDILIKPTGVAVSYVSQFKSNFFGFAGVTGASGFGCVNDPQIGGELATLITLEL